MKIVINGEFGGFSLSHRAVMRYAELKGIKLYYWVDDDLLAARNATTAEEYMRKGGTIISYATIPKDKYEEYQKQDNHTKLNAVCFSHRDIERTDAALIKVVEELGGAADGACASLKIVEIPDDVDYEINEYDGWEHVAEKHRTWH